MPSKRVQASWHPSSHPSTRHAPRHGTTHCEKSKSVIIINHKMIRTPSNPHTTRRCTPPFAAPHRHPTPSIYPAIHPSIEPLPVHRLRLHKMTATYSIRVSVCTNGVCGGGGLSARLPAPIGRVREAPAEAYCRASCIRRKTPDARRPSDWQTKDRRSRLTRY